MFGRLGSWAYAEMLPPRRSVRNALLGLLSPRQALAQPASPPCAGSVTAPDSLASRCLQKTACCPSLRSVVPGSGETESANRVPSWRGSLLRCREGGATGRKRLSLPAAIARQGNQAKNARSSSEAPKSTCHPAKGDTMPPIMFFAWRSVTFGVRMTRMPYKSAPLCKTVHTAKGAKNCPRGSPPLIIDSAPCDRGCCKSQGHQASTWSSACA